MTFVAATCPSCGGNLQVPDERDQVKCMYCGGDVIVRQAIQLASGVNVGNLMLLAKAAAAASNSKEAYDYYTKSLEYDPTNATAWVGKGEAAGWMSTINELKLQEMTAGFDNAIKYTPESGKQPMREECAEIINRVVAACYSRVRNHCVEFIQLDDTWDDYLTQCAIIVSALEVGHCYDPANKTTMQKLIQIYADNIRALGITIANGRNAWVVLSASYATLARQKIKQYTVELQKVDPNFTEPEVQKPPCFVATATMGDVDHPLVAELRGFRDSWLVKRRAGRLFIRLYYEVGPHLARFVGKNRLRRRLSLWLIVRPAVTVSAFLSRRYK